MKELPSIIATIPLDTLVRQLVDNIKVAKEMNVVMEHPELYVISQTYRWWEISKSERKTGAKQYSSSDIIAELSKHIEFKLK
jgi:hypothetical protein